MYVDGIADDIRVEDKDRFGSIASCHDSWQFPLQKLAQSYMAGINRCQLLVKHPTFKLKSPTRAGEL